jgi:hypothetical protein
VKKAQEIFFEKCKIYSAASLGNLCVQKNETNNECTNSYNKIYENKINKNKINRNT